MIDQETLRAQIMDQGAIVRTAELYKLGLDQRQITRLVETSFLVRVKSGYYRLSDQPLTDDELILSLYPDGVLTMESALYVYGYLKRRPKEYAIAVSKNTSKSRFKLSAPLVRPYYTEEPMLSLGVEGVDFGGGFMKIYSKERLICEVMRFEDKMEREDVKSALTAYIREKEHDLPHLTEYAIKRQVKNKVMNRIADWL